VIIPQATLPSSNSRHSSGSVKPPEGEGAETGEGVGVVPLLVVLQTPLQSKNTQPVLSSFEQSCSLAEEPAGQVVQLRQIGLSVKSSGVRSSTNVWQVAQSPGPLKPAGQLKKTVTYPSPTIPQPTLPWSVSKQPAGSPEFVEGVGGGGVDAGDGVGGENDGEVGTVPPLQVPSQLNVMQPVVNSFEQSYAKGEAPLAHTEQLEQIGLSVTSSGVVSPMREITSQSSQSSGPDRLAGQSTNTAR
jgi:hypothetical protein